MSSLAYRVASGSAMALWATTLSNAVIVMTVMA
jgi:hypothetical protein